MISHNIHKEGFRDGVNLACDIIAFLLKDESFKGKDVVNIAREILNEVADVCLDKVIEEDLEKLKALSSKDSKL